MKKEILAKETVYKKNVKSFKVNAKEKVIPIYFKNENQIVIGVKRSKEKKLKEIDTFKAIIDKNQFKYLFGPKNKPQKGDTLSIVDLGDYEVLKSKKRYVKNIGKHYKIKIKKIEKKNG